MDRLDLGWFQGRFALLERLMWIALAGGLALPIGLMLRGASGTLLMIAAVLAITPFVFYLTVLPVLHWKDGYRGKNSSLWGALLVLETSGWFKIVYWLRHLLPDYQRARRLSTRAEPMPTLNDIEREVRRLAARIGAPGHALPTFGHPDGDGRPHVEVDGAVTYYVVSERGIEHSRRIPVDADQLLRWIFADVTFAMAADHEAGSRRPGEDARRRLFARQLDLLRALRPAWADDEAREQARLLATHPFRDGDGRPR